MIHRTVQRGFGLVELLVAIVVGLLVLAAVTSLVVAVLRANNENLQMTRLTQELRAVAALVTRDLRRASFTPQAIENVGILNEDSTTSIINPFAEVEFYQEGTEINFVTNPEAGPADCVLFSYDDPERGTLGTLDDADRRGFRFNSAANSIEMLDGDVGTCTSGPWESLTDPRSSEITAFQFFTRDQDAFDAETAGDLEITVRRITVAVSGRLASDAAVNRTVAETIRIRNDLLVNHGSSP